MDACPPPEDLMALLAETLDGPAAATVPTHVRACARCQARLDALSDDPELRRWAAEAGGSGPDSHLGQDEKRLIDRLRAGVATGPARDEEATEGAGPCGRYSFLGPPRREGDLGVLGGYSIRRELGRGGMGIVLLAFDEALQRNVALKVLRPELADDRARARFVREARAAARVRHDHVVGVHSVADPPDGPPFCILEYLAGPSLAERVRAEGRLGPREAAALAAQVADGLAAAHAAGLVHRDVKPGNILSDPATGRAKIADFGLARASEASDGPTQVGVLAGTPAYMSPEQARGSEPVGPASDIYGLGTTLYEALTGEPPFRGASHTVLQRVLHDDPRPPRELNSDVPRDLEAICLTCLRKEPHRRYSDASALAADLRRFLRGEPIAARPARAWAWERWARWARRRPVVAGLAVFSALATLALIVGDAAFSLRLHAASQLAELRRRQAEANFQKAFEAVDRMLSRVGGERLVDVPEMEDVRREVLADALEFLKGFLADRGGDDPMVRRELGLAYQQMATIHSLLGRYEPAREGLREALAVQSRLAAEFPGDPQYRRELASSHIKLAALESEELTGSSQAETHFRTAIATLEPLAREVPAARDDLVRCLNGLVALLGCTGRDDEGRPYTLRARTILADLSRENPEAYRVDVARLDHKLGQAFHAARQTVEAEAAYRRALAVLKPLALDRHGFRAYRVDLADDLNSLGHLLAQQDRSTEAEALLAEALAVRQTVARQYPLVPFAQDGVAYAHHALGWFYARLARVPEAEAAYLKAIAIREPLASRPGAVSILRTQLAESCLNLGVIYHHSGRPAQARPLYEKAAAILEALAARQPDVVRFSDSLVAVRINLTNFLYDEGRSGEALPMLDRLVEKFESLPDNGHVSEYLASQRGIIYGSRAQVYNALGRHAEAIVDWDRLIELTPPPQREPYVLRRCQAQVSAGHFEQAAIEADRLAASPGASGEILYNCACVHALIAGAAFDESEAAREAPDSTHVKAAVALLERARSAGFLRGRAGCDLLAHDHDIDSLRSCPEFHEFALDLVFPDDPFVQ